MSSATCTTFELLSHTPAAPGSCSRTAPPHPRSSSPDSPAAACPFPCCRPAHPLQSHCPSRPSAAANCCQSNSKPPGSGSTSASCTVPRPRCRRSPRQRRRNHAVLRYRHRRRIRRNRHRKQQLIPVRIHQRPRVIHAEVPIARIRNRPVRHLHLKKSRPRDRQIQLIPRPAEVSLSRQSLRSESDFIPARSAAQPTPSADSPPHPE